VEILYLLVPLSVVLVFLVGAVFWFALRSGQFDDLEAPGLRMLADDDRPRGPDGPFDLGQKRSPAGRYDDTLAVRGSAQTQGAKHAGTGDL
jgi:cbb3-type cytochrome oxidase maturation protein